MLVCNTPDDTLSPFQTIASVQITYAWTVHRQNTNCKRSTPHKVQKRISHTRVGCDFSGEAEIYLSSSCGCKTKMPQYFAFIFGVIFEQSLVHMQINFQPDTFHRARVIQLRIMILFFFETPCILPFHA